MIQQEHLRQMSLVLFLILVLLAACASNSGSISTGNPSPTSQVYSSPSWWNGKDCDKGNYPAAYDLLGYGSNGNPKTWRGIEACGPLPGLNSKGPQEDFHGHGATQYEFQCTELIARYELAANGLDSPVANGAQIVDAYTNANTYPNTPLHKVVNDGNTHVFPAEGDVLSYGATSANGFFGHTSLVIASSMTSPGNGTITVLQQNMSWNGAPVPTDPLTVSSWVIQPSTQGAGSVISWMTTRSISSQSPTQPPPTPTPSTVLATGTWQDPYGGSSYVGDAVTMRLTVQGNTLSGTLTGTTGDSTPVHGQDGPLNLFSSDDQQHLNFVIQNYGYQTGIFLVFTNDSQFEGAPPNCQYYGVVQQNGDIQGFWYFPNGSQDVGSIHMNKVS